MERIPNAEEQTAPREKVEQLASQERNFLRHLGGHKLTRLFLLVTTLLSTKAFASEGKEQSHEPLKASVTQLEGADPANKRMEGAVARWLAKSGNVHRLKTHDELEQAITKGEVAQLKNGMGYHVRKEEYLEPFAIEFVQNMGTAFAAEFPDSTFDISSAGRTEEHQAEVIGQQQNPFAADPGRSTHPFFMTFDVPFSSLGYQWTTMTKHDQEKRVKVFHQDLKDRQMKWVTNYLGQQEKDRLAQAKFENNNCFHVAAFPFAIPPDAWENLRASK